MGDSAPGVAGQLPPAWLSLGPALVGKPHLHDHVTKDPPILYKSALLLP